jgi:hypothetical protein
MTKLNVKNSKTVSPADTVVEGIKVSMQQKTVPLLPHERDQSTQDQVGPIDVVVKQAAKDIARGLKDTDRGEEADRVYQKLKRKK